MENNSVPFNIDATPLKNIIYDEMGGYEDSNFKKVEKNLCNSRQDNLQYLGTYFPRTLVEYFLITEELHKNKVIENTLKNKEMINILSIGCGTGGDIIGLLLSLSSNGSAVNRKIQVHAIDGNNDALELLGDVINKFNESLFQFDELSVTKQNINLKEKFYIEKKEKFDFIITSKFLNEIDCESVDGRKVYKEYIEFYSNFLNDSGIMIITDVASQSPSEGEFIPIRMSRQIGEFLIQNSDFSSILPLCCIHLSRECFNTRNQCCPIITLLLKLDNKIKKSKFTCRVICKSSFYETLALQVNDGEYIYNDEYNHVCPLGSNISSRRYHAYDITNTEDSKIELNFI